MLVKELTLPQTGMVEAKSGHWAVFFILCGLANIYIAFWLPQKYLSQLLKVFGLTALTLIFYIVKRYLYLPPHARWEDKSQPDCQSFGAGAVSSVLLRENPASSIAPQDFSF